MNNTTLLTLAVAAVAATFVTFAQAQTAPGVPAAQAAATPASAPAANGSRANAPKPVTIPRLDLNRPAGPDVMCACVRPGRRA